MNLPDRAVTTLVSLAIFLVVNAFIIEFIENEVWAIIVASLTTGVVAVVFWSAKWVNPSIADVLYYLIALFAIVGAFAYELPARQAAIQETEYAENRQRHEAAGQQISELSAAVEEIAGKERLIKQGIDSGEAKFIETMTILVPATVDQEDGQPDQDIDTQYASVVADIECPLPPSMQLVAPTDNLGEDPLEFDDDLNLMSDQVLVENYYDCLARRAAQIVKIQVQQSTERMEREIISEDKSFETWEDLVQYLNENPSASLRVNLDGMTIDSQELREVMSGTAAEAQELEHILEEQAALADKLCELGITLGKFESSSIEQCSADEEADDGEFPPADESSTLDYTLSDITLFVLPMVLLSVVGLKLARRKIPSA